MNWISVMVRSTLPSPLCSLLTGQCPSFLDEIDNDSSSFEATSRSPKRARTGELDSPSLSTPPKTTRLIPAGTEIVLNTPPPMTKVQGKRKARDEDEEDIEGTYAPSKRQRIVTNRGGTWILEPLPESALSGSTRQASGAPPPRLTRQYAEVRWGGRILGGMPARGAAQVAPKKKY